MNSTYYQQPVLDGWANSGPFYDHRFMGYDRAPYGSLYLPPQPAGPYQDSQESESLDEAMPRDLPDTHMPRDLPGRMSDASYSSDGGGGGDDDDDDGDNDNAAEDMLDVYHRVSLQKIVGKQLAVWCHRAPDTLAIFTPIPGDNLQTAVSFARSSLQCDPSEDRILILAPGQKKPVDASLLQVVLPGSSMLVVPQIEYVVSLEVSQLKVKLQMVVSVTMTVRQVKAALQKSRGYPASRVDLLFQDQPMENQRHLFDYHVKQGSTIFVMLHLLYDTRITVETFWGVNYKIYVDPCMTTANLLDIVLRRTISPQAGDVTVFFHLILPRHALVMFSENGTPMKWNACLGLYGCTSRATFNLSTIALAHQMSLQTVPVVMPRDMVHNFRISKFDYWSVLALKLHGLLGHPVNLMRLFQGRHELDLAHAAGSIAHKASRVHLDMSLLKSDIDVYGGVYLTFRLGRDVEEELILSPARTVKSVKIMLEELGIPNATAYDLFVDGVQLPEHGRIGDMIEQHKRPIHLKLRHYPVFVHAPKNVIYKMNAHAQESLKVFKGRVEMKTGLSYKDYFMLMAGLPVADNDSKPVFQSSLAIGTSVFLMALQNRQTFFVVWDDWLVKLRLPFHPQPSEIKDILLKDRNIPEGSLASVGNFLQWHFAMKSTKKDLLYSYVQQTNRMLQDYRHRQSRPKKKRDQADAVLWKKTCRQIQELQQTLEDRYYPPGYYAPSKKRAVPPVQLPSSSTESMDREGLYYSSRKNGHWRRVNPEDIADTYLRAWSMPPDPTHRALDTHRHRSRKLHSATPDTRAYTKKRNHHRHHCLEDPEWVFNLKQMALEDRLEPAHTRVGRKKRRKRKVSKAR